MEKYTHENTIKTKTMNEKFYCTSFFACIFEFNVFFFTKLHLEFMYNDAFV